MITKYVFFAILSVDEGLLLTSIQREVRSRKSSFKALWVLNKWKFRTELQTWLHVYTNNCYSLIPHHIHSSPAQHDNLSPHTVDQYWQYWPLASPTYYTLYRYGELSSQDKFSLCILAYTVLRGWKVVKTNLALAGAYINKPVLSLSQKLKFNECMVYGSLAKQIL